LDLLGSPAVLELKFLPGEVVVSLDKIGDAAGIRATLPDARRQTLFAAHERVIGLLGLGQDAAGFARLARRLGLGRLVAGRPELRLSQTHSVFDGLLWSIIGQQINFPFACTLKRRLIENSGRSV